MTKREVHAVPCGGCWLLCVAMLAACGAKVDEGDAVVGTGGTHRNQGGGVGGASSTAGGGQGGGGGAWGGTGGQPGTGGAWTGTGGWTNAGGSWTNVGGATVSTGGRYGGGGASLAGAAGSGGTPVLKPIQLVNGVYTAGDFSGPMWTAADGDGSTVDPPCGTDTCFMDQACVKGTVTKVPLTADGGYDYDGAWGTMIGWTLQLNDDGGASLPVSVSDNKRILIGLSNTTGLGTVRVGLEVPSPEGGVNQFCKAVTLTDGQASVYLTSLKTACWGSAGVAFDPATMKPTSVEIQFVSDTVKQHPFALCVTQLIIE